MGRYTYSILKRQRGKEASDLQLLMSIENIRNALPYLLYQELVKDLK
jgi:hypothetical protein